MEGSLSIGKKMMPSPLRRGEGIRFFGPGKQLLVQLRDLAEDDVMRPAAGVGLRLHRDARGLQRSGKTEREHEIALRQLFVVGAGDYDVPFRYFAVSRSNSET